MQADKGVRAVGYLIDVLPAIVIGLFGLIPFIGIIIAGFLLAPYWLLRAMAGARSGKLLTWTTVVRKEVRRQCWREDPAQPAAGHRTGVPDYSCSGLLSWPAHRWTDHLDRRDSHSRPRRALGRPDRWHDGNEERHIVPEGDVAPG